MKGGYIISLSSEHNFLPIKILIKGNNIHDSWYNVSLYLTHPLLFENWNHPATIPRQCKDCLNHFNKDMVWYRPVKKST